MTCCANRLDGRHSTPGCSPPERNMRSFPASLLPPSCLPPASLLPPSCLPPASPDDGFGDTHAAAVCRRLGYTGGGLAFSDAPFGFEPTQSALAGLNCSAGQGPEGCFAYSIAEGACIPQVRAQGSPICCQRFHGTTDMLQRYEPCAVHAGVRRRRLLPTVQRSWWVTA